MKNTFLKANLIIHLFALAHALTVLLLRQHGLSDEIPLTILTIVMIILVGRNYNFPLDVSAMLALLFCFAGFYMGTQGAEFLSQTSLAHYANIICTVVITEILGWATVWITKRNNRAKAE